MVLAKLVGVDQYSMQGPLKRKRKRVKPLIAAEPGGGGFSNFNNFNLNPRSCSGLGLVFCAEVTREGHHSLHHTQHTFLP